VTTLAFFQNFLVVKFEKSLVGEPPQTRQLRVKLTRSHRGLSTLFFHCHALLFKIERIEFLYSPSQIWLC